MKLGFLTDKVTDIEKASRLNFPGIELNARAFGHPERDVLNKEDIAKAKQLCAQLEVEITAIAYYDVAFDPPAEENITKAYERVFDTAEELGVQIIASMSGFDANRDWAGNIQLWADRFGPVADVAEERGMRIAFENWMGFGGSLPFRPRNMGGSPNTWEAWFSAVPSKALGLEFDPSHLYWQGIDHMRALYEFKERIYHVHAKDTEMFPERRYRGGVNGDYYRFRIPGYGEINWASVISALQEIGYDGGIAIEHEDPIYQGDRFDEGLIRGWQELYPLIHPTGVGLKF